jgi:DNA-binding response OmpR family regulator
MTAALYERIEELTAERDYWKAEAGALIAADTVARLRNAFALTHTEASMVAALYTAGGKPLLRLQIEERIPPTVRDERTDPDNFVHVMAWRIRRKLGHDFLQSQPKRYQLSPGAMERCKAVFA